MLNSTISDKLRAKESLVTLLLHLSPSFYFSPLLFLFPFFSETINEPLLARSQILNRCWNSCACDHCRENILGRAL